MLADRRAYERRQHEGRIGIDRILRVILREHEHAGLPLHRHPIGEHDRRGFGRRDARLFGELKILFGISAGDQRQRRVIEIGQVVGLPLQKSGRRREVDRGPGVGDLNRRRGKIVAIEAKDSSTVLNAEVPLAEMFGYATAIRSLSKGRSSYSMEPSHFQQVPANLVAAILDQKETK